ncbi:hypothetical protein BASA81_004440 [Batrachochytrium salamandrivorans]|nr:hypothetical protein BASA81_004440 [Batrachochytrium salamandrivorans]
MSWLVAWSMRRVLREGESGEDELDKKRPSRARIVLYYVCMFGASEIANPTFFWFLPESWRYFVALKLSDLATRIMYPSTSSLSSKKGYFESQLQYNALMDCLMRDDGKAIQSLCTSYSDAMGAKFFGRNLLNRAVEENAVKCVDYLTQLAFASAETKLGAQRQISEAFSACTSRSQVQLLVELGGLPVLAPGSTDMVAQIGYPEVARELVWFGGDLPNKYCLQLVRLRSQLQYETLVEGIHRRRIHVLTVLKHASPALYQVDDLSDLVLQYLDLRPAS